MQNTIIKQTPDALHDNLIDRRGLLKCMAWVGTGLIWTISGGVPSSRLLGAAKKQLDSSNFSSVQISDSRIGFNKPANPDVAATPKAAVDKINGLPSKPEFLIHTGDSTHLAKPAEFNGMDGVLQGSRAKGIFFVPGEQDVTGDDGKFYLERDEKKTKGRGWYRFDHGGIHFIGLNNVVQLEGLGNLGADHLAWLQKDVEGLTASTPLVIFAHIVVAQRFCHPPIGQSDIKPRRATTDQSDREHGRRPKHAERGGRIFAVERAAGQAVEPGSLR